MNESSNAVTHLSEDECWERLATRSVGRLATSVGGALDIVPVNYVVDGRSIVFRTAPGSKLVELTINDSVAFETDAVGEEDGWSVVVHGSARALETEAEQLAAEELPLRPFIPTLKPTFVRIDAQSVTGRGFVFGEEPRREDVQDG